MRGRIKTKGFGSVLTMLKSIGERVPDTARGLMKRSAVRIVNQAKIYVPEDEELLKDSIKIEKTYDSRRRLQIGISAGVGKATKASGKVINLEQYAAIIHERYDDSMKPGKKTIAKRAANPGVHIGAKFLERAAEEEDVKLRQKMIEEITKTILGARGK